MKTPSTNKIYHESCQKAAPWHIPTQNMKDALLPRQECFDVLFPLFSIAGGTGLSWKASNGRAWSCSSNSLLNRRLISSDERRRWFSREQSNTQHHLAQILSIQLTMTHC